MQYITIDQIICMVSKHGPGGLIAKFDVDAECCNNTVHSADRWQVINYTVNIALPFGFRSASFILTLAVQMVKWISLNRNHLSDMMHYLNDLITTGPLNSALYMSNLQTVIAVCKRLGLQFQS